MDRRRIRQRGYEILNHRFGHTYTPDLDIKTNIVDDIEKLVCEAMPIKRKERKLYVEIVEVSKGKYREKVGIKEVAIDETGSTT